MYLKIIPTKISTIQSTIIRGDLANQLELKARKTKINISAVKNNGDSTNTKEFALKFFDTNGKNELYIRKAFTIPRKMFNVPSQNPLAQKEIYQEFPTI